jgi:hypothetical protein
MSRKILPFGLAVLVIVTGFDALALPAEPATEIDESRACQLEQIYLLGQATEQGEFNRDGISGDTAAELNQKRSKALSDASNEYKKDKESQTEGKPCSFENPEFLESTTVTGKDQDGDPRVRTISDGDEEGVPLYVFDPPNNRNQSNPRYHVDIIIQGSAFCCAHH